MPIRPRQAAAGVAALMLVGAAIAFTPTLDPSAEQATDVEQTSNVGLIVNWRTLGCVEPAALPVEEAVVSAEDAGLVAERYSDTYGVDQQEALRRLAVQPALVGAMEQVYGHSEPERVASSTLQHTPYFSAVVRLSGTEPVTAATRAFLCTTPEIEVHLDAGTSTTDLNLAQQSLGNDLFELFDDDLVGYGLGDGELSFTVVDDATVPLLDAVLAERLDVPYSIESMGLSAVELDPVNPFPLWRDGGLFAGEGVSGTILIDEPCVYLNDALVVLPVRQTIWDPAEVTIDVGTGPMRSGDEIDPRLGAAVLPVDRLDSLLQPPDSSCDTSAGVLVLAGWTDPGN